MDILVEYLFETIKRNFVIDYKKTKKNCRIKLVDVGTDLIFNKKGSANISEKLNDNTQYQCKYDERLHLYTTEEELSNFGSGISVEVNFSGIVVPFVLFPDEMKSIEIVGRKIFRDKFASKKSFEVGEGDHFYKGSQEYYTRTNLSKELSVEKIIINERILHGKCKRNYGTEKIEINSVELRLPISLKQAYYDLLQEYKNNKTVPTLAYMSDELHNAAENYLKEFLDLFVDLEDGMHLCPEQENALLLGTLIAGRNEDEVLFTPFHPLNIAYQLELCNDCIC